MVNLTATILELSDELHVLHEEVHALEEGKLSTTEADTFFLLWAAVTVFLMQAGFGMLEAGSVRAKNTRNILLKNLMDACIAAIIWFIWGMGIAYGGSSDSGFIGTGASMYALSGIDDTASDYTSAGYDWISWLFQYVFAAAASTIVSGAISERAKIGAYMLYTCFITGFIYPVVVHWVWDSEGWISAFNTAGPTTTFLGGVIDFAGSGVVHMTGGVAGLVGAAIIGPRTGRFVDGKPVDLPGHSAVLAALGTFLLWFGWYGFNPGSTLGINTYGRDAARVAVTTTLAPAGAALVCVLVKRATEGIWDVGITCNGILGGLVSITAACPVVTAWASILIGIIGGAVYIAASKAVVLAKVDDPLDAFAVHGACGFWGVLAVGIFCTPEYTYNIEGYYGLIYGGYMLIIVQLVCLIAEIVWVAVTSAILFGGMKAAGVLRIPADVEEDGLDASEHGGSAYQSEKAAAEAKLPASPPPPDAVELSPKEAEKAVRQSL